MQASNFLSHSTVDQREIDHYKKLASLWWNRSGPFWPLHKLNEIRIDWIQEQLLNSGLVRSSFTDFPFTGLRVLDVGCGGGILSESLAKLGANVTGIDVVEKNLSVASLHAQKSSLDIQYELATVEEFASRRKQFDVVFSMEVVEHVANISTYMRACSRLTRLGGMAFVATINRNVFAWLTAIIGAEYILKWLPRGTHHYSMLRKPNEIKQYLSEDGFSIIDATGVRVNPINRKFSLTPSMAINYMLCGRKQ